MSELTAFYPRYYPAQCTESQFRIDGEDVLAFANVRFAGNLDGEPFSYGAHLIGEPRNFSIANRFGPEALLALACYCAIATFPQRG